MPQPDHAPLPPSLLEALDQSRTQGFLGDGPLEVQVAHAQGFGDALEAVTAQASALLDLPVGEGPDAGRWMDLGSGGGIPGLVLAHRWPGRQAVFLDSNERRGRFLRQVVEDQGWEGRVRVVTERAEVAGRAEGLRGSFSLVVARSFGPPPVTAECAAPFLRRGGILIVSEPPVSEAPGAVPEDQEEARWPAKDLVVIGLEPLAAWRHGFGYQVLGQAGECPERFPRRVGVPAKRPLYRVNEA